MKFRWSIMLAMKRNAGKNNQVDMRRRNSHLHDVLLQLKGSCNINVQQAPAIQNTSPTGLKVSLTAASVLLWMVCSYPIGAKTRAPRAPEEQYLSWPLTIAFSINHRMILVGRACGASGAPANMRYFLSSDFYHRESTTSESLETFLSVMRERD